MRVLVVFAFAFATLAAAERDRSKDLKVAPINARRIPHKPSTRIKHGNEAVPHSRPWQVGILNRLGYTRFCGGSLIDEQNVLTVPNCLSNVIGPIEVILGAHNIEQRNETTQVVVHSRDFVVHENHDFYHPGYEIALIRLPSPVTFNEYIQPIPLDNGTCDQYEYTGQDANVSGWGWEPDSSTSSSPVLREVTTPVLDKDLCYYYYGTQLTSRHLCTDTTGGKSLCDGDFGAPLVLDGKQIGIGTYVFGHSDDCAVDVEVFPGVYISVCKFSSWIEQNKKR